MSAPRSCECDCVDDAARVTESGAEGELPFYTWRERVPNWNQ